jgi:phosphate transport system permease protein
MRRSSDRIFVGLTLAATLIILVMLGLILGNVILYGKDRLTLSFITGAPEKGMTTGGIFPAIFGTALLVLLMSLAAVPFGVLVAIYFAEYARVESRLYRWTRMAVNNLAGVPSIVFGLFGLGFFIETIGRGIDQGLYGGQLVYGQPSILWASMTMALLTLPVVIVSVEEAIRTVPRELREGSLALGATKWKTIWKIVLPGSITGILTGAILAVSRGAGEVAPILFTGAAYFLPQPPHALSDQFMELGYHVYIMSTQSTDVDATRGIQYATTLVLLVLTFLLNFSAIYLRYRMRRATK